jgi:outer membrane protein assembly factor BamB
MRIVNTAALWFACGLWWTGTAPAQFRGGPDWMTAGVDARRSFSLPSDPKISAQSVRTPGFQLVWKIKLSGDASPAATLGRYIGYRGFRSLAFVGGRSGEITAIDTDLGRVEWRKNLGAFVAVGSADCPAGVTANLARPTEGASSSAAAGRGGGFPGRTGPAKSAVGQAGEGAVTIAEAAEREALAANGGRGGRGPGFDRKPSFLDAIASDGKLHSLYVSDGGEPSPAVPFLPAHANAFGLTVIDNVAYAATVHRCGGAPNGLWALDLESRQIAHWSTEGDVAGEAGAAFAPDGAPYVTTSRGELVELEAKTLKPKATYRTSGPAFVTSPVIFEYKTKTMIAAATADQHLHVVDAASLTGTAYPAPISGALASWEDADGTRWFAAPAKDSISAWKMVEHDGALVLQPGWTSREMAAPLAPLAVNGVVFAVSNSSPPVLYAFDAATGKDLWNSGRTLAAPVRRGGLSASEGQLYLETSDGIIYAFGFPIEH